MIRNDEIDIIGVKPRRVLSDFGPLFATPSAPPPPPTPIELRSPADYAQLAASSRDGLTLVAIATKAANAILDAQGCVAVWEVRLALQGLGKLANDGTEGLDAFGALGRSMKLSAVDRERPPAWAMRFLEASHGNWNTVWVRPQDVATYTSEARRRRIAA